MDNIFLRSFSVGVGSVVISLLIAGTVVPALGGTFDGTGWLLCVICPMVVAWPASAHTMLQKQRIMEMHARLQAAHAELGEAHMRLSEKTRRDPMTGMLNRENFIRVVESGHPRHTRGALLVVDADSFRAINDAFGYCAGDDALIEMTGAICRAAGQHAVVGRIGGEEFGVYLPETDPDEASAIAEQIRREVEATIFRVAEGRKAPMTVSVGCAFGGSEMSAQDLLRQADARMCEAKKRGRNRIVSSDLALVA